MSYQEVIRATDRNWKVKLRKLCENRIEFVVIGITTQEQFRDCKAWAQEFDYCCTVPDPADQQAYEEKTPSTIGFKERCKLKFPHGLQPAS